MNTPCQGTWTTPLGEFRLRQHGDRIYGDFGDTGSLTGTYFPDNRVFTGSFSTGGIFQLSLSVDGARFAGRWGRNRQSLNQALSGDRQSSDRPQLNSHPCIGTWDTNRGELRLRQEGTRLYGTLGEDGFIEATHTFPSNQFQGSLTQPDQVLEIDEANLEETAPGQWIIDGVIELADGSQQPWTGRKLADEEPGILQRVTAPLAYDDQGDAVGHLQRALIALGFALGRRSPEQQSQAYGTDTAGAVGDFKERYNIPDRESDRFGPDATAQINQLLAEQGLLKASDLFQVSGQVAEPYGRGIPELTIRAYDKCLGKEQLLGETQTNAEGRYVLRYSSDRLINPLRQQPGLIVRTANPEDGTEIASPLILNALSEEVINLVIGDEDYRGPDLYSQLHQQLAAYLEDIALDDIEPRDLYCLANNTNTAVDLVQYYVQAQQWQAQWGEFPPEVFFAWFKDDMPLQWGSLLSRRTDELKASLERAIDENWVPQATREHIDSLEASLIDWRNEYVVTASDRPITQAALGQLFEATPLTPDQRRNLLRQWQTHEGDAAEFWASQREQLGEAASQDLELTLQLGVLTRNHVPLVETLKQRGTVRQFNDIARLNQDDWTQLLEDADVAMPDDIKGEDVASQRRAYASALTRFTEALLPTRVMTEAFSRDPDIDSQRLEQFFSRNPDFEFRQQSLKQYLAEHPDALEGIADPIETQRELEAYQRVFHLSPPTNRATIARALWQENLRSAPVIALRGVDALLDLSPDKKAMKPAVKKAQTINHITQMVYLQGWDWKNSLGHVMPEPLKTPEQQIEGIPDLESLFGGQGYCECKHCLSFFSPSAYLVDLFVFLKNGTLGKKHQAGPAYDTVLEKLFQRRPDLANIELNCDNTHTTLPYIDLVNEVLENAIDPRTYANETITIGSKPFTLPVAEVPQTDTDAATLKAFPQHLNPGAYLTLAGNDPQPSIAFPWNLPFSLWATEVRTYLDHLQVPRWQLMASLLNPQIDEDAIATEYLGLIPAERTILIDTDRSPARLNQYWAKTPAELKQVETLLQQSELTYADLRQLLDLRYIQAANPNQSLGITFNPPNSCQVADAEIEHLTPAVLSRLHRLVRLQRQVNEPLLSLDQTVMALGGEIDPTLLQDLAYLYRIEQTLPRKIKRSEILTWWSLIDTHAYPEQASFYESLFLNPGLSQPIEAEFEAVMNGTSTTVVNLDDPDLSPDLLAQILGALQWKLPELKAAVVDAWQSTSFLLNLDNLSSLYRVASFCRALRLKVSEYLTLKVILGLAPLPGPDAVGLVHPQETYAFIQLHQLIKTAGLDAEILDYLLRHQYRAEAPFALGMDDVEQILLDLQVQINKAMNETAPAGVPSREQVQMKLYRLLPPEAVTILLQILDQDADLDLEGSARNEFLEEKLPILPDLTDAKAQLLEGGLEEASDRYDYVLNYLDPYLVENGVVQLIADALELSTELAETLLKGYLPHPSDASLTAIRIFLKPDFLTPGEGVALTPTSFPEQSTTLVRLHKIGLLINRLELDIEAIQFLLQHGSDAGLPNLTQIPLEAIADALAAEAFQPWQWLIKLVDINQRYFPNGTSAFAILADAFDDVTTPSQTQATMLERLSAATGWDVNDLNYLLGPSRLNLTYPQGYQSVDWLLQLADALPLVTQIGASAKQIAQWCSPQITDIEANSVRHAVKAKYGNEQWLEITAPLRDRIREQQRDALLSYVLLHVQKHDGSPFSDADDLYAYYLIDPQMSACALTSRTKLAISAVQLFVQRILMSLEPGMELSQSFAEEWQWRKQYRVWEANRKVLLWPENYIEPELRDDKSPFFKELENDLLQDQLNEATVERAYVNYLYKLNDVARLEICGVYYEEENKTLHVFGRTAGIPSAYYYRRWENRRDWTPWEKVELDIYNAEGVEEPQTGVLLLPIVHNRRLFLFWPTFTLKKGDLSPEDGKKVEALENDISKFENWIDSSKDAIRRFPEDSYIHQQSILIYKKHIREIESQIQSIERGYSYYSIKIAYSSYSQGHWTAPKSTERALETPNFLGEFKDGGKIKKYVFQIKQDPVNVRICPVFNSGSHFKKTILSKFNSSCFRFESCGNQLILGEGSKRSIFSNYLDIFEAPYDYGKRTSFGQAFTLDHSKQKVILLRKTRFYRMQLFYVDGKFDPYIPFFYEDSERIFFIVPPPPQRANLKVLSGRASNSQSVSSKNSLVLQSHAFLGKDMIVRELAYRDVKRVRSDEPVLESDVRSPEADISDKRYYRADESKQTLIRYRASETTNTPDSIVANLGTTYISPKVPVADLAFAPEVSLNDNHEFFESFLGPKYEFFSFYHPHVCTFLKHLNQYGIEGLLCPKPGQTDWKTLNRQATPNHRDRFNFREVYNPNLQEVKGFFPDDHLPAENITFRHQDPYASYNWELFFHIPLLIATRLHQDQRFEEAQKWFHYIFNPTETEGDAPYRFWKIKPFFTYTQEQMKADMESLLKGEANDQIEAWEEDPFNPHLLARLRKVAYMKTVVMKYLDNLIAWGDLLFRRDTIESLNEATQLYVLAGQILGKLPVETEAKDTQIETFSSLAGKLDNLGNALVEIDIDPQEVDTENSTNSKSSQGSPDIFIPYFCFPPNEKLLSYWDTVADRLFKIRNCMNIEGLVRQLPLFQPPIDPALLVRATAAGIDLNSALNDFYGPMPHYRFSVMIQKAQEICQELKSLGGTLLSTLEKKDAEALAMMRVEQETILLQASKEIRKQQVEETQYSLEVLHESKELANIRFETYRDKEFANLAEEGAFALARLASIQQVISAGIAAGGATAYAIPDSEVGAIAGACGGATNSNRISGGDKVGKALNAASQWIGLGSIILKDLAEACTTVGQYTRRKEDWDLQRDLAEQEMKQIDKQILAAEIRIAIAEQEKSNLDLQISQSENITNHYQRKYTNKQLYGWMLGQLSSVYFQTYKLAYDIAQQAEKAFRFELGIDKSNYIKFGYWDNLKKGLLSGEKLSLDLKRLEMAYFEQNRREYELTKHISLRQLDPIALLALKTIGKCDITLPEGLFDLDIPGHYMRRIKNVSLSIPAVTGPYTSINCTLSLKKSTLRRSSLLKNGEYARNLQEEDNRFVDSYGMIQSIVTSSGQNDSGLFEANLRDERFLPFEGCGAIDSKWTLELPTEFRQFDYDTISDVILHIRYTARQGGDLLKQKAIESVNEMLQGLAEHSHDFGLMQLFSLKHDFPTAWHQFVNGEEDFTTTIQKEYFPYFVQSKAITISEAILYAADGPNSLNSEIVEISDSEALQTQDSLAISLSESEVLRRNNATQGFLVLKYTLL